MIIFYSSYLYLTVFLGLLFWCEFQSYKCGSKSKRLKRLFRFTYVGFILFPFLFIAFFWYALGVSFETHYGIERGSWMWYMRMDNSVVNNFPVIEPIENVKYNDIGGDNPHIGSACSVVYTSFKNKDEILILARNYFNESGIIIHEMQESYCWQTWDSKTSNQFFYKDSNYEDGCLELKLTVLDERKTKVELFFVN